MKLANMQNGRAKMVHQRFCSPFAKSGCKSFPTVAWGVLYSCIRSEEGPIGMPFAFTIIDIAQYIERTGLHGFYGVMPANPNYYL